MGIYLTRHGVTTMNAENKICGLTDVDLSEDGIKQAEYLAKYISENQINLDLIISSPMRRAVKTAEIIGHLNSVKVISDLRIIEQNYGIYEGADRYDAGFLNNKRQFAFKYPGGESMMQTAYRVYGFLDEIKALYPGKNILIVSHGGVCRVINTYFEDVTNDEFFHWQINNCELRKYSFDNRSY